MDRLDSAREQTDGVKSRMVEYEYDVNDNLRNNRPAAVRPKCTLSLEKPPENVEQTIRSSKDEQSPIVSLKTPRMPSTLDDFEVMATIGTGSYGTCKKIRRKKDGKVMVWKEMEYGSMTESEKQMLVSEVNLLRELRHQHIVRYYDRIIDRTQAIIYIIMEYCQGGDLASIISRNRKEGTHVSEDFAWKILIQATLALKECHRRKNGKAVLHRDLKPANVFLDAEANVKLGDFGLARVLHHEHSLAQTYVGTPYYMSPELVNNQSYNEKSDIWSLGCMLYELCALAPPFTATNEGELKRKIRIGQFPRLPTQYSLELDMIIRRMIQVECLPPRALELLEKCSCENSYVTTEAAPRVGRLSPSSGRPQITPYSRLHGCPVGMVYPISSPRNCGSRLKHDFNYYKY
ncbi:serine/threonine-protein kinase Nek2 [Elysia marginata]|uniref:Serine/threonine-protein kinase Nek2 n=1 Tax=Elysia marginata TaxID=1093978 RepID=A0AAV4HD46_9GAST|nr:serine/threonine-protein kinase Nek2 [Elysia marginata]